jgi:hypothetical protein
MDIPTTSIFFDGAFECGGGENFEIVSGQMLNHSV